MYTNSNYGTDTEFFTHPTKNNKRFTLRRGSRWTLWSARNHNFLYGQFIGLPVCCSRCHECQNANDGVHCPVRIKVYSDAVLQYHESHFQHSQIDESCNELLDIGERTVHLSLRSHRTHWVGDAWARLRIA